MPASIDIKGSRQIPLGNYRVERADEDGEDPVGQLLARFPADTALSILTYVTKLLRLWDGEGAVHEDLAEAQPDGTFLIRVPPPPNDAVHLIYVRDGQDQMVLLGGYLVGDGPSEILAALEQASSRRPGLLKW